ncbi:MAG TPA: imelysin family protein [Fluviicola sp.]|nr:imelysin family protein [Fluviicola sp.]
MKKTGYWSLVLLSLMVFANSCKDKKDDDTKEEFKKEEILTNLADNYIIPGYADLQTRLNSLSDSWNNFVNSPSQAALDAVRADWQAANVSFHRVKLVEVGPAMTVGLGGALGTFPADTVQIENNITAGTYNLTTMENIDAIGFESLDFLLYGSDCLNKLTLSSARRTYVTDVINKMRNEVNQVVAEWSTYRSSFIAGTGTSSTSPFSLLVNAFCKDYELAKSAKLGIPIGTQSLGIQQPAYLEARRSGFGKALLLANIEAVHAVFDGKSLSGSSNGQGFDDYLNALDKGDLSATIDARFASMEAQQSGWSGTLEEMMTTSPSVLMDYYNYMQGTVVYLKTDMAAAFGVLITYQDGDGD